MVYSELFHLVETKLQDAAGLIEKVLVVLFGQYKAHVGVLFEKISRFHSAMIS